MGNGAAILAITSLFLVVLAYFYLVHDVIFEALKSQSTCKKRVNSFWDSFNHSRNFRKCPFYHGF